MFAKGQRVVCVDDNIHPSLWEFVQPLRREGIYKIRDIVPGISGQGEEGNVAVYLEEIHNTVNPHGIERGYNAERFVPMAETDFDDLCQNADHYEHA